MSLQGFRTLALMLDPLYTTGDAGRPIACYRCDSHYDPSCAAPFNNMTQHLFRCPQGHDKCSVTIQRGRYNYI